MLDASIFLNSDVMNCAIAVFMTRVGELSCCRTRRSRTRRIRRLCRRLTFQDVLCKVGLLLRGCAIVVGENRTLVSLNTRLAWRRSCPCRAVWGSDSAEGLHALFFCCFRASVVGVVGRFGDLTSQCEPSSLGVSKSWMKGLPCCSIGCYSPWLRHRKERC